MMSMPDALRLVSRAARFAADRHNGQTKKDERTPYVNHLAEVAALIGEASGADDPVLLAAAWLHDVVEDEHATSEEIGRLFGEDVRSLVDELTDDMSLPSDERKERQVAEIGAKSRQARLIKLADKTSNIQSVLDSRPPGWGDDDLRAYVEWAIRVVDAGCRNLDPQIEAEFDLQVRRLIEP